MSLPDWLPLVAAPLFLLPYAPWVTKKLRARFRPRGWPRPVARDSVRPGVRHTQGSGFSLVDHINNFRPCQKLMDDEDGLRKQVLAFRLHLERSAHENRLHDRDARPRVAAQRWDDDPSSVESYRSRP